MNRGTSVTEDQILDQAHDPSHELSGAAVQRVFYVVNTGAYALSPEFSTRDQAAAYARNLSVAGEFGSVIPAPVDVEVRTEYRPSSGRTTQYTAETSTITA